MRRQRQEKRRWEQPLFLLALSIVVFITVLFAFFALRQTPRPSTPTDATPRIWQVTLCYPDLHASRLVRMPLTLSAAGEQRVIEELAIRLKSPENPDLSPAIPPDAQLLSVKREGDTVVLDFDEAFAKNEFWQGSDVAHLRLQALVHTIASLPGVHRIRILVNGQPPPALGGHEEVSKPITPDPSL